MSANPRPLFITPGERPDASLVHRSIQLDPVQLAALEAGVPTASTSACTAEEVPVAVVSTIPEATFLHMPVLTGDAAREETEPGEEDAPQESEETLGYQTPDSTVGPLSPSVLLGENDEQTTPRTIRPIEVAPDEPDSTDTDAEGGASTIKQERDDVVDLTVSDSETHFIAVPCLLYTSDAADE